MGGDPLLLDLVRIVRGVVCEFIGSQKFYENFWRRQYKRMCASGSFIKPKDQPFIHILSIGHTST